MVYIIINYYYCIAYIYSFSNVIYNHISWEDVKEITSTLGTSFECISTIQAEFNKCDTNNDSFLTFHQFIHFVSHSFILWKPLYKFRELCWQYVLPVEHVVRILNRKSIMPEIRKYQLDHDGQLPPLTCKQKLHKLLSGEPHPYLYYYDSGKDEIFLENLLLNSIRCLFPHRKVYRVTYNMENVTRLFPNIQKDPIEFFYIHCFKRNTNNLKCRSIQEGSMKSSLTFTGSASHRSILRHITSTTKTPNGNNQDGGNKTNQHVSCLISPNVNFRTSVEMLDMDPSTTITPSSYHTNTTASTNVTISASNSQAHNSLHNFAFNVPEQNYS